MISNREIHVKNKWDAQRALAHLRYESGPMIYVVKHALQAIIARSEYAIEEIVLGERT